MKKKENKPSAKVAAPKPELSLEEIQKLINMLNKSNVSELSIERANAKITLRTHNPYATAQLATAPVQQQMISAAASAPKEIAVPKTEAPAASDDSKYITIKSPMIGTFYRTPSPDKPPFINVGDEITTGTVLCVIEAMKLFNEIESEHKGKIVKILVENAKPVEYDQPLFLIEP
ncbi:MAG: acetyl-CoA carboxylase biotin carboxyl carrier protein [Chitinophagales bacterium]|nr:acetyl-CoA carboxylase biotin carboxyl carrier protein [Chitinophagales bacterium]